MDVRLTDKEREIYDALYQQKGGIIREHVNPAGTRCFRHLDARRNPLANYQHSKVMDLIGKGVLTVLPNGEYELKEVVKAKWEFPRPI